MAFKNPLVPVHAHYKQIQTVHVAKHDLCAAQCALKECARDLIGRNPLLQMGKQFLGAEAQAGLNSQSGTVLRIAFQKPLGATVQVCMLVYVRVFMFNSPWERAEVQ